MNKNCFLKNSRCAFPQILSGLLRGSEPLTGEKKMKSSSLSSSGLAEQGEGVEADKGGGTCVCLVE